MTNETHRWIAHRIAQWLKWPDDWTRQAEIGNSLDTWPQPRPDFSLDVRDEINVSQSIPLGLTADDLIHPVWSGNPWDYPDRPIEYTYSPVEWRRLEESEPELRDRYDIRGPLWSVSYGQPKTNSLERLNFAQQISAEALRNRADELAQAVKRLERIKQGYAIQNPDAVTGPLKHLLRLTRHHLRPPTGWSPARGYLMMDLILLARALLFQHLEESGMKVLGWVLHLIADAHVPFPGSLGLKLAHDEFEHSCDNIIQCDREMVHSGPSLASPKAWNILPAVYWHLQRMTERFVEGWYLAMAQARMGLSHSGYDEDAKERCREVYQEWGLERGFDADWAVRTALFWCLTVARSVTDRSDSEEKMKQIRDLYTRALNRCKRRGCDRSVADDDLSFRHYCQRHGLSRMNQSGGRQDSEKSGFLPRDDSAEVAFYLHRRTPYYWASRWIHFNVILDQVEAWNVLTEHQLGGGNPAEQRGSTAEEEPLDDRSEEDFAGEPTTELETASLYEAAALGYSHSCKVLLESGSDVNATDKDGNTPLHRAAANNHIATCKLLLDHGAEINSQNADGVTPLHQAARREQRETCALLLEHGADVNAKDQWGDTPLHWAVWYEATQIIGVLLHPGADPNVQDEDGRTPLHMAAKRGHKETCALLLEHGADPDVRNADGRTPLHHASWYSGDEICRLFIEYGADIDIEDKWGDTPRWWMAHGAGTEMAPLTEEQNEQNRRKRREIEGSTKADLYLRAVRYVKNQRKRGRSDQKIKAALRSQGWSQAEINHLWEVLANLTGES